MPKDVNDVIAALRAEVWDQEDLAKQVRERVTRGQIPANDGWVVEVAHKTTAHALRSIVARLEGY